MRRTIGVGAVLIAIALLGFYYAMQPNIATIVLRNQTGANIQSGTVGAFGNAHSFGPLANGQTTRPINFSIRGDGDYEIDVVFASGKSMHAKFGYLTNGFDFIDEADIGIDGVRIVDQQLTSVPLTIGKMLGVK